MRTSLFVNSERSKEKTSPHLHSRQMQTATLPSSETWFIWGIANANAASKLLLCHALRLQKQPSSEHRASLFCQKSSGGSCSCASIRSLCWAEGCRSSAPVFPWFCGWVRQGGEKWSREVPCPTLAHCSVLEGALVFWCRVIEWLDICLFPWPCDFCSFCNEKRALLGPPDMTKIATELQPCLCEHRSISTVCICKRTGILKSSSPIQPQPLQGFRSSQTRRWTIPICGCYKLCVNTNINVCGKGLWAFPSPALKVTLELSPCN